MDFDPDMYELSEYFAGPPSTYHLVLPSKWRMKWLVWRSVRAARRQPTNVVIQLTRPLDEETGYASITTMDKQDYDKVLGDLQGYFGSKGLTVSDLGLKYIRRVKPSGDFQEPYDLVHAMFTVAEAR